MSQPTPEHDPHPTIDPVPEERSVIAPIAGTLDTGNLQPVGLPTPDVQATRDTAHLGGDEHPTRPPEPGADESAVLSSNKSLRYRSLRPLGHGGLGEVFVALDGELNREVALKEIQARHVDHSDTRRRFLLEAEVTGRLEHPGVVPVYGLGTYTDGRPYYAMRLIKGESFKDAINQFHDADKPGRDAGERSLAFRGLLRRFLDVCNAVAFAHSKGVLHRDLKPDNVMLGPFGETLVIDWGLAKVLDHPADDSTEASLLSPTFGGQIAGTGLAGTPAFMSPEQAAGRTGELEATSDIYSLGAILYDLVSGRHAFPDKTVERILAKVRRGDFLPPCQVNRTVAPALEAVCLKAMALRTEDRYVSAKDLAADVDHWLADEPVTAYREPLTARVRRWGRRHRALVSSLTALLLTATAGLAVGLALVNAERSRTATARDDERRAKEAEQQANVDLTAALARETKLKENLEIALKSAAEQRKLALETMKDVVNVFDARLKNIPGLQDLRKELLDRAKKGLQKVARTAETAAQIDYETVWVHFELGDIFLNIDGATQEAKEQYELARKLAQKVADMDPRNVQSQRTLANSQDNLGDVQLRLGDTKAALEAYRESVAIRQKLADTNPRNAEIQRALSVSHSNLGNVQLRLGDTKAALEAYQASLAIGQKLADADLRNADAQRNLSVSHNKLGKVQLQLGNTRAALEDYRAGLVISQKLADADPRNSQAQSDLSYSHSNLGDVQLQLGDTKAALEEYRLCHGIRQKLVDADPRNSQAQSDLSYSHSNLGDVQLRLGDTKASLEEYRLCHGIRQKLVDADPRNSQAQSDLSYSDEKLGDVQLQLGDTKAALEAYRASLAVSQKLADADPRNAQAQRDLAVSHNRLGNVQLQLGDMKAALGAYRDGRDISQKLADADPGNAQAQRDLYVSHERLGTVQLKLGDKEAALKAYRASVAICQKLADADPRNAEAQSDLSHSLVKLGDVQLQLVDIQAALEAYRASLAIDQKLADADPRNGQAQRGLMVSLSKLGDVALQSGEFRQAADWYAKALYVLKRFGKPEFFTEDARILEPLLLFCRDAAAVSGDLDALSKVSEETRSSVLTAVMVAHVLSKQPDKAMAAADLLARNAKQAGEVYDAACGYARCVPLADNPETKEQYAAHAVALLKQAVAKGFKDAAQMKKDTDLDAMRERADFKALLKELETKPPDAPK